VLLKQQFGYEDFRPGQADVVEHLLEGHSAAAVFPTGGGKSICYQLPALMLDGLTIVVSPLIALMKDQIDALAARGVQAARIDSSLDAAAWREVMNAIRTGELRLLYVSPERFNNERFVQLLKGVRIALFAVDEAHCISEWGHNFRPDYLKLAAQARDCSAERVLRTGFHRPNLSLRCQAVSSADRNAVLISMLNENSKGSAIVYVTLQKSSEQIAAVLLEAGFNAKFYHAGMTQEQRTAVQDWFIQSNEGIVVATIAFGMGIDKSDIRQVIHYNLPKSLENYAQEIGRAGRDGKRSYCQLLACPDDLVTLENFVLQDTPAKHALRRFVDLAFPDQSTLLVSHQSMSQACDIRPLVLRTLLTRLQLKGYLESGTPFHDKYQFKPRMSSAEILQQLEPSQQDLVKRILRHSIKARLWFSIDIDAVLHKEQLERAQVVGALDSLAEADLLELKVTGVRFPFRIVKRPEVHEHLVEELYAEAQTREQRELDRLAQMLDWIRGSTCHSAALSARFDETIDRDCGHCGWCVSGQAVAMERRASIVVDPHYLKQGIELQETHKKTLVTEVEVARLLCGLSSPAISKARLQRHALFGVLQQVPYRDVLKALQHKVTTT